jgi:hypothetical protein
MAIAEKNSYTLAYQKMHLLHQNKQLIISVISKVLVQVVPAVQIYQRPSYYF